MIEEGRRSSLIDMKQLAKANLYVTADRRVKAYPVGKRSRQVAMPRVMPLRYTFGGSV